ncbi:MAG: prepilin-type N-terminal cleavage/methylation domain-containing protein [Patescibacteria group bacterium]
MQKKIAGFTLIELIIGITILSLLAVALLAALDPVEQFNKARDTATRNTAMEIHNGILRYNAAKDTLPSLVPSIVNPSIIPTVIAELVAAGELKTNFKNSAGSSINQISIFSADGTAAGVKTCYRPSSKQFLQGKNNYVITPAANNNYLLPSTFPASPGTCTSGVGCIWCAE